MKYDYYCESGCTVKDYVHSKIDGLTLTVKKEAKKISAEPLVWEESHGMGEDPIIKCPVCGEKAAKSLMFSNTSWHIRGNWALDKAGCQREMHIHKLNNPKDNPYEAHYEKGEKDEIKTRLLKAGKRAMRFKQKDPEKTIEKKLSKKKNTIVRYC